MAAADTKLRMSGFKRILVRLDEDTRRKYCCHALEEDLQRVKLQVLACTAAMDEAKEVEDATCKLHASQRAVVSSELLVGLKTLQQQLESATNRLVAQSDAVHKDKDGRRVKEEAEATEASTPLNAKTLAREIMLTQEVEVAMRRIRQLEKLMPEMKEVDDKKAKWWKKHVAKVVAHTRELVQGDREAAKWLTRLQKSVKKIAAKYPELQDSLTDRPEPTAKQAQALTPTSAPVLVVNSKKRSIALSEKETAVASHAMTSEQTRAKASDVPVNGKAASVEKVQALLYRCSREVRTLRDKFELGAYDVNLSRMVTVVDSLWSSVEHSEVVSLTTALFTLVEIVEKVVNPTKRRDRLACLESVLGVVLSSSKLQLAARRKTMAEEYANNCRQSLEQLNRQLDSSKSSVGQSGTQKTAPTSANIGSPWSKSHVRFG